MHAAGMVWPREGVSTSTPQPDVESVARDLCHCGCGNPRRPSYDELQANAVLKQCPRCGTWAYWTHPQREVCIPCRS